MESVTSFYNNIKFEMANGEEKSPFLNPSISAMCGVKNRFAVTFETGVNQLLVFARIPSIAAGP